MTTHTDTTVDVDVDLGMTAGCKAFTECPRTAAWLVIFPAPDQSSCPMCEYHRPLFLDVMAREGLDSGQIRFVRI